VHYPAGYGHRITLHCGGTAGDSESWNQSLAATWTTGDVWTATVPVSGTGFACKPLYDDTTWSVGPNYAVSAGGSADIWPHFFHTTGTIDQITDWHSNLLDDDRGVWIYEPPSYTENPAQVYPVVYMQDGQNLFYDEDSFSGVSWNVGGAMDQGASDGSIPEAIIIGIDNDDDRTAEYTPVADPDDGGGSAAAYLAFLVQELKPQIDAKLRTVPDAAHTAIVGSSLGALLSLYAGMTDGGSAQGGVFGLVGALSPSTWWDNNWVIGASASPATLPQRLYLDSGNTGEDDDDVTLTAQLAQVWRSKSSVKVDYLVQDGASHGETYWRQRIPGALSFLLAGVPVAGE
jgi:predicted alpha/beta superfamily hydrolase